MSRCYSCRKVLHDIDSVLTCGQCEFSFHCGECSGVSENTLKGKREQYRKSWKCEACRAGGGKSGTSAPAPRTDSEILTKLAEMDRKLSSLLVIPNKMTEIEKSMQMLSDQFDKIQYRQDIQEKEIKEVKRKVEKIESTGAPEQLCRLESDLEALEWRSRRLNIEIHGIAETEGENLLEKVNSLGAQLEMQPITSHDVVAVHRLPAKTGKARGIILRFVRQETRDAWIAKRKVLREKRNRVFINENLTSRTRKLLAATKEWAKDADYQFVWHANGKVLMRKSSGEPVTVVKDVNELRAIST